MVSCGIKLCRIICPSITQNVFYVPKSSQSTKVFPFWVNVNRSLMPVNGGQQLNSYQSTHERRLSNSVTLWFIYNLVHLLPEQRRL